jgi:hypothetical protein
MTVSKVYLANPVVIINSVDLTSQCTKAVVNYSSEALENTSFSNTSRTFAPGLFSNSITVTLYQSYLADETEASIFALVGTTTTVFCKTASGDVSATNPSYTLTGAFLGNHTPINATLGELSMIELEFVGGDLDKAVS